MKSKFLSNNFLTLENNIGLLQLGARQETLSSDEADAGVDDHLEDAPHQHHVTHTHIKLIDQEVVGCEQGTRE